MSQSRQRQSPQDFGLYTLRPFQSTEDEEVVAGSRKVHVEAYSITDDTGGVCTNFRSQDLKKTEFGRPTRSSRIAIDCKVKVK